MGDINIGSMLGQVQGVGGLLSMIGPADRALKYRLNIGWPNMYPDPETVLGLYVTGQIDAKLADEAIVAQGLSFFWTEKMSKLLQRKPEAADLISMYRRGLMTPEKFLQMMKSIGVQSDMVQWFFKAYEYFPPPPDLIRFAVREVYSPEIIEKLGMMQDIPQKFLQEGYKAGLNAEYAKNYWAAHWELPSINQMFEMFQREEIDRETLNMGLKALDVMPYWRDKLTNIAYNVITRVDARRFYGLGVYDENRLNTAYKHMGYSPADAADLVEFTKRHENREVDGITRASLINAYKRELLTKEELGIYFTKLGYAENVVSFWMESAEWEKSMADFDLVVEDIKDQYFSGSIDIEEVRFHLTSEGFESDIVESLLKKLQRDKAKKRKIPSKSEIDEWLKEGIIDDSAYFFRMRRLGYIDDDIRNYMTSIIIRRETVGRRFLKLEDYQAWTKSKIITMQEFEQILIAMNYATEDIERILSETEVLNAEL